MVLSREHTLGTSETSQHPILVMRSVFDAKMTLVLYLEHHAIPRLCLYVME